MNFRRSGVVGFDLAGEEAGYPPKHHIEAFHFIQRSNLNITIHAGEAFGMESIWQAIQWCGPGAVAALADHPFHAFHTAGFRVTLNTDDRLMSNTSMTKEFMRAAETFGLGLHDFEKLTLNAMKSAFLPFAARLELISPVELRAATPRSRGSCWLDRSLRR